MAISNKDVHTIALLLCEDPQVIRRWSELGHFLETPVSEMSQLQLQVRSGVSYYDVIHALISSWRSRTGSGANIAALRSILSQNGFMASAERIPL